MRAVQIDATVVSKAQQQRARDTRNEAEGGIFQRNVRVRLIKGGYRPGHLKLKGLLGIAGGFRAKQVRIIHGADEVLSADAAACSSSCGALRETPKPNVISGSTLAGGVIVKQQYAVFCSFMLILSFMQARLTR